jgi:hypothetical protein
MELLIKFPTRQRPTKFFEVLDIYYSNIEDLNKTKFIISCDIDDVTMNNEQVINRLKTYPNLQYFFSNNKSKIEACNANLENQTFDILLLASDDMYPIVYGFDEIIRNEMELFYPDTDGVLFHNDNHNKKLLNTLCILGKKYYDRFKYIYFPQYHSFWCDNEFQNVADLLNKQIYFDNCIIEHRHPIYEAYYAKDELYRKNDLKSMNDKQLYNLRKQLNFGLKL